MKLFDVAFPLVLAAEVIMAQGLPSGTPHQFRDSHYEAIVRMGTGSEHVTVTAPDVNTATRQIEMLYCIAALGGGSCIIEGPWPLPGK